MVQKIKINSRNVEGEYVLVYPETTIDMIIVDETTGETLGQKIASGDVGSDIYKLVKIPFIIPVNAANQTDFVFSDPDFNNDVVHVHLNGEFLHAIDEYTVDVNGPLPKIKLLRVVALGDKIHVTVERLEKTNVNVSHVIGDVSTLETQAKTLVGAINEVNAVWK